MKETTAKAFTSDQSLELIARICSSHELGRAERLKELLHYLAHRALEDEHVQISEFELGVEVFVRRNFDTSADNIVRVTVSDLRKRIKTYYATEGADELILLDIPRGSYTPVFSRRGTNPASFPDQQSSSTLPEIVESHLDARSLWVSVRQYAAYAMVLLLTASCLYLAYVNRTLREKLYAGKSDRTLDPFWSGILESPRDTDVVVGDTAVAAVEEILGQRISLPEFLDHQFLNQIEKSDFDPNLKGKLAGIAIRDYGSISDFYAALKIRELDPESSRIHLQFARDFPARAIGEHNVVLIGNSRSNPWCTLFENDLNFVVGYDSSANRMLVRNRHPLPGESAEYLTTFEPGNSSDFSTIAFIPNRQHSADVLIIAGTDAVANESAATFLASRDSLQLLREKLHVRTLPYFELLLRTARVTGTPSPAEIVAFRALSGKP